jgi:hypothetical protein
MKHNERIAILVEREHGGERLFVQYTTTTAELEGLHCSAGDWFESVLSDLRSALDVSDCRSGISNFRNEEDIPNRS